jgi:hypothetical protein
MGLRNAKYWKEFLKKLILDTFNIEVTGPVTTPLRQQVSIFDFNIKTHSVLSNENVKTWEDYANSMYRVITNECRSHRLEELVLCIDDPSLVPKNKGQTQKSRDIKDEEKKIDFEDIKNIKIGKGDLIPPELSNNGLDLKEFKKAMLEHRSIKFSINSWLVCQVVKKASLEKKFRIMGESIDAVIFKSEFPEVEVPKGLEKIRFIAHIDHNNSFNNIKLQVGMADSIVGEGEQLCIKYMNNVNPIEGEVVNIVIHSTDTDFITYLLCHCHNLVDPVTKDFNKQVYLIDSTQHWDINKLYYNLYSYFIKESLDLPTPVLLLCLLMIIDGNDFTEGLKGITAKDMLDKFFKKEGYKVWQYSKYGIRPFLLKIKFGNRNSRETFRFEEGVIEEYIRNLVSPLIIEEEDLKYYVLRVKWTFDYMLNGGKSTSFQYFDPVHYGWEVSDTGEFLRKNELMRGSIYSRNGKKGKEMLKKEKEEKIKTSETKAQKKKPKDDSNDKRQKAKAKVETKKKSNA